MAIGVALLISGQVAATNGYFAHGYGPVSKSMAGACVAVTESAMCSAHNPAILSYIEEDRLELGVALFSPDRGFQANNDAQTPPYASIPPGTYESDNEIFLIPHFAYTYRLDEQTVFGLIMGGNGGLNTEYSDDIFRNFNSPGNVASSPASMDMIQLFAGFNFSRKINSQHSLAIMPILAVQRLEVKGLEPFRPFSLHPDKVTNNGKDWSYGAGARFGWLWQATDALVIGASYQTRTWMTDFDDYKGLLADEGSFDIPPIIDLGFAYLPTPKWTLAFNYQRIQYEKIGAISNPADLVFMPGDTLLGTEDGLGFGWEDVDVYKFGVQWVFQPDLRFRAGFGYTSDTFEGTQALFNILAPAVVKKHFTFGLGKTLRSGDDINLSVLYAPNEKVYGTNPNTGPQTGYVEMSQWEFEIGAVFKY